MAQLITADGPKPINSWGYRLQGDAANSGRLAIDDVLPTQFDLIAIDFSSDGLEDRRFFAEDIARIRNRGQDGIVLGYVAIGGVADYRSMWNPEWTSNGRAEGETSAAAPSWLAPFDPAWPDGRRVRFWEADWQSRIFNGYRTGWVDLIAGQGFDGALVDVTDCLRGTLLPQDNGVPENTEAARRAVDLVLALARHVKERYPAFMIVPLNGDLLLDELAASGSVADAERRDAFLAMISAVAVEDVYCPGPQREDNAVHPDEARIELLVRDVLTRGKPVLSVEYLSDAALVKDYETRCAHHGFVPYAAPSRDLDRWGEPYTGDAPSVAGLKAARTRSIPADSANRSGQQRMPAQRFRWTRGEATSAGPP
ncbi:MAG: endo alpha-1,4 polygalactosaminidase [Hyphomicrobiaceae bacterium]